MQLPPPHRRARSRFDGTRPDRAARARTCARLRPQLQMIFQDPISSLNPRRKVGDIVAEPLEHLEDRGTAAEREAKVDEVLEAVGIDPDVAARRAGRTSSPAASASASPSPGPLVLDPKLHHLRRAGVGPRRVGAGPDPEPARGHEGPLRPDAGLHRPRPRRGEERERPGGGDVPRQALRGRRRPTSSTPARPTRTPRPCSRRSRCPTRRSSRRIEPAARRRAPVAGRPAQRLPVPHPLPAGPGALRRRRSPRCARSADGHYVACHFPLETPVAAPGVH